MLKPVDAGELSRVFQKVHEALDQEFDEKQSIHRLKITIWKVFRFCRKAYIPRLIEGTFAPTGFGKHTVRLSGFLFPESIMRW